MILVHDIYKCSSFSMFTRRIFLTPGIVMLKLTLAIIHFRDVHSNFETKSWVERIVVLGLKNKPKNCLAMLTSKSDLLLLTVILLVV